MDEWLLILPATFPTAQALPLLATFVPVPKKKRHRKSRRLAWLCESSFHDIKPLSPTKQKRVMRLYRYRLYIGSFSADTYTFEWNLAIKPKGFFSRLSCGMVTSIIKSAQRSDGSDSRTDRLWPLLSNEIRQKKKVYIMIMIFLEKVESFLNCINSLKHGSWITAWSALVISGSGTKWQKSFATSHGCSTPSCPPPQVPLFGENPHTSNTTAGFLTWVGKSLQSRP